MATSYLTNFSHSLTYSTLRQLWLILSAMRRLMFFNKTVKKYLASFVADTTLNWENFLLALMLS
jgi:hypothetical protein